ncbi:MAG: IS4 family transposase, partial [Actinomycetota bacterium]
RTDLSLTAACGDGLRQAAHRIFEHPETSVDGLLAGHFAATAQRCAAFPVVLVAQDTTVCSYRQAQLEGLGPVSGSQRTQGLLAHSALALTEAGTPLGLLHLELWGHADGSAPCAHAKESGKWQAGLESVARHLVDLPATAGLTPPVHAVLIQDREGDFYDFLAAPRAAQIDLLVRVTHDRKVQPEAPEPEVSAAPTRLRAAVAAQSPVGELAVRIPVAAQNPHQILPRLRQAVLTIRRAEVRLLRPGGSPAAAPEITVRVLEAREEHPPAGETAVSWTLTTTLPVRTLADAGRVVGYYARRWVIERLHFTLKSGLRAERLQIDDARSLSHCLALYYVVAWRLLQLTYLAREDPERPAVEVLAADEIAVLEAAAQKPVRTLAEAVRESARLGGYQYYRTAPPPGVKSLWLGWRYLTGLVQGWRLAHQSMTLD